VHVTEGIVHSAKLILLLGVAQVKGGTPGSKKRNHITVINPKGDSVSMSPVVQFWSKSIKIKKKSEVILRCKCFTADVWRRFLLASPLRHWRSVVLDCVPPYEVALSLVHADVWWHRQSFLIWTETTVQTAQCKVCSLCLHESGCLLHGMLVGWVLNLSWESSASAFGLVTFWELACLYVSGIRSCALFRIRINFRIYEFV